MRKFIKAFTLLLACVLSGNASAIQVQDTLRGKTIVVIPVEKKSIDTGYTIDVDGKLYKVWRGPKGGMYYITKEGKVYLTQKQKALIK